MTDRSGAVVVPMASELALVDDDDAIDPWRMLAEGTGMLVAWERRRDVSWLESP